MPVSGTVADFAFYVDRPIIKYNKEDALALSLKKESTLGYLKKKDYTNLSEEFRKSFLPVVETENFLLISHIQNYKSLLKKIFPIFIYQ